MSEFETIGSPSRESLIRKTAAEGLGAACEYYLAAYAFRSYVDERKERGGFSKIPPGRLASLKDDLDVAHHRVDLATSRATDLARENPWAAADESFAGSARLIRKVLAEASEHIAVIVRELG